jgi:hypothetical protein
MTNTNYDNLPAPRPRGDFDLPLQGPNALNLDESRLRQVASGIRTQGITREQLIDIANRRLTDGNPLLSHVVGHASDDVQRNRGDVRSFNRGATLGLYLIDEASEDGAPVMGVGSMQLASRYRKQPPTLEDLRMAADGLLASQEALSGAFDEALAGMPEGTDRDMARFGAGITTLGVVAAAQFGGTGTEMWVE